jgi:hypothetical protein
MQTWQTTATGTNEAQNRAGLNLIGGETQANGSSQALVSRNRNLPPNLVPSQKK